MIDAAISSSGNQHIMLYSSTTVFGNDKSEAADQLAAYNGFCPPPHRCCQHRTHFQLQQPMKLIAAFRFFARRSDTHVGHCAEAAFATPQGNLSAPPSFLEHQQYQAGPTGTDSSRLRHLCGWQLTTSLPPPIP